MPGVSLANGRLLTMFAAREWVVSAHHAGLSRQNTDRSLQEINLKVLEKIERVERRQIVADA